MRAPADTLKQAIFQSVFKEAFYSSASSLKPHRCYKIVKKRPDLRRQNLNKRKITTIFYLSNALGVCRYFYIGVEQLVKVQDAEKAITSISRYMHCPNYLHSIQITKFYLRSTQSEYLGG